MRYAAEEGFGEESEEHAGADQSLANGQSLEAVCAVLTALADRIDDFTTPSEARVLGDIFEKLEQLASNSRVSKRMNCLLNDLIDLRAGLSTKKDDLPEMIQKRAKKKDVVPSWCESTLWWQFKSIEHTLEVVDSRDEKLKRLRSLAQMTVMKSETAQMTVICQQMNLKLCRNAVEQIRESTGVDVGILEYSMSQQDIAATISAFHKRTTRILFITADVATRRGFDITPSPGMVLLNFDYPASAQLYLFRIFKRTARLEIERPGLAESVESVKVFTFFEAEYDVPPRLGEIALADPSRQMCYEQAFGEDPNKKTYGPASKTSKTSKSRDRKDAPEKQNSNSQKSRAKGSRSPV